MLTYYRLGSNGRLGNQIWQILGTVGLARTLGEDVVLPPWEYAPWFSFPDELWGEPQGTDAPEVATFIEPTYRPYLQHLDVLHGVAADALAWLRPSPAALKQLAPLVEQHRPAESAAVHVRRGDYAEAWRGHGMLERDWYVRNWPTGRVLVFSDDPAWCIDNLPGIVVHTGVDWLDWHLMAMCRSFVISNSTFAWWAAMAGQGPTTYPVPWFTGLPDPDILPGNWTAAPR